MENNNVKIDSKEFQRRVKEMKKKQALKRVIFVAICIGIVLIILLIIWGIVSIINAIIQNRKDADYGASTTELVGGYIDSADSVFYSDGIFFVAGDSSVQCLAKSGTALWEHVFNTEDVSCVVDDGKALAYSIGGNELVYLSKTGAEWRFEVQGEINFASINSKTKTGLCCYNTVSDKAEVCVFDYSDCEANPDAEDGEGVPEPETLLIKNYRSGYVVSAALSTDGKTVAIGELSESDSIAATKVSLITVKTGKNFFTKVFDKEVCPYMVFCEKSTLVVAGGKNVYTISVNTTGVSSKVNTLCSYDGENNAVLSVAVSTNNVAVVGGNSEGTAIMYVYDLEKGSSTAVNDVQSARGVVRADNYYALYSDGFVYLVDNKGNIRGTSGKFALISEVFSGDDINLIIRDAANTSFLEFIK